ncbi:hypothetical protein FDECE_2249 [Fusarium decemcellulare]|nr:hypothetical protein FDECE_2249 [Fusarium decemcellulare]
MGAPGGYFPYCQDALPFHLPTKNIYRTVYLSRRLAIRRASAAVAVAAVRTAAAAATATASLDAWHRALAALRRGFGHYRG